MLPIRFLEGFPAVNHNSTEDTPDTVFSKLLNSIETSFRQGKNTYETDWPFCETF